MQVARGLGKVERTRPSHNINIDKYSIAKCTKSKTRMQITGFFARQSTLAWSEGNTWNVREIFVSQVF